MNKFPNIVAFIFARGGSKGLPGKNIRPFNGKPLIAWAIQHAKLVERVNRVIVSTDCQNIADIAVEHGAEAPFLRPKELATDLAPEWLSWRHALEFVREESGAYPDVMVTVPVTAPLRLPEDINKCIDVYLEGKCDMVITVSDAKKNPYFNMVTQSSNGLVDLVIPTKYGISRRQDAPAIFDITTVAYVADPHFVMTRDHVFSGKVKAVKIPAQRAIDIDTKIDFDFALFLSGNGVNIEGS